MGLKSVIVKTLRAMPIMVIGALVFVPASAYVFQLEYRDAAVVAGVPLLAAFMVDRFLTALFAGGKPEEPPQRPDVLMLSAALVFFVSSLIALTATLSIPLYWLLGLAEPMNLAMRISLVGGLVATTSIIVFTFVALSRELTGLAGLLLLEFIYCFLGFPSKLTHSIERRLLYH